jgi:hypothetical protein
MLRCQNPPPRPSLLNDAHYKKLKKPLSNPKTLELKPMCLSSQD